MDGLNNLFLEPCWGSSVQASHRTQYYWSINWATSWSSHLQRWYKFNDKESFNHCNRSKYGWYNLSEVWGKLHRRTFTIKFKRFQSTIISFLSIRFASHPKYLETDSRNIDVIWSLSWINRWLKANMGKRYGARIESLSHTIMWIIDPESLHYCQWYWNATSIRSL